MNQFGGEWAGEQENPDTEVSTYYRKKIPRSKGEDGINLRSK
jgi:hypothetical protein